MLTDTQLLLPTPYSLLPTPYSLLPTPYSLLPTPYSLLPAPLIHILHDRTFFISSWRKCNLWDLVGV